MASTAHSVHQEQELSCNAAVPSTGSSANCSITFSVSAVSGSTILVSSAYFVHQEQELSRSDVLFFSGSAVNNSTTSTGSSTDYMEDAGGRVAKRLASPIRDEEVAGSSLAFARNM
jgi:hypothetical protein